jgi:hypothetical protein
MIAKHKQHCKLSKKSKKIIIIISAILMLVVAGFFVTSPPFGSKSKSITGKVVSTVEDIESDENSDTPLQEHDENQNSINQQKTFQLYLNADSERFTLPIHNMDLTIKADAIDILTPSADISLMLEEPMVFEAFSGSLNWENSLFTLDGQLASYFSELVKINWKTDEEIKVRVTKGEVIVSKLSLPSFESIVSGEAKLDNKLALFPEKERLIIDKYRGDLTAVVSDNSCKLLMNGTIQDIVFASQNFDVNID